MFGDLGCVRTLVEHGADLNYLEQKVLLYSFDLFLSTSCFIGCVFSCPSLCFHHWWQRVKRAMKPLSSFFWRLEHTKRQLIQYVGVCVMMYVGRYVCSCILACHCNVTSLQDGYTALHLAALNQHVGVVECLLDGNCPNPNVLAQVLSYCALFCYAMKCTSAIVTSQDNVTPLMCAAASGSKEIAEALIEREAEVDAVRVMMHLIINMFL